MASNVAALARKPLELIQERRLPWKLRWLKYLRVTRPIRSARVVVASFADDPRLPSLFLHEYGPEFLEETLAACARAGMKPFLAFGTLLGHYRDGGFIRHDADIDMGLLEDDFAKRHRLVVEMERLGYTTRLNTDTEVAFYRAEFPTLFVDFFRFRRSGASMVYHDSRGATQYEFAFPASAFDALVPVKFLGRIDAWIPAGVEAFLQASYGDWRTPRTAFDNVNDHPNMTVVGSAVEGGQR